MRVRPDGRLVSFVVAGKASSPIRVTVEGMRTNFRPVQRTNA